MKDENMLKNEIKDENILKNEMKDDYYGEQELIECIRQHGSYIQDMIEDYIRYHLNIDGGSKMHFCLKITSSLQRITESLCAEFQWMKNIIPPFEHTKNQILSADHIEDAALLTKECLSMLYQKFDDYYPDSKSEISKKALEYILSEPFEKHALSDIANLMFTNNTYLSHSFKLDIGISFVDYCNRYKMESAKILLHYTKLNIKEIADKLKYDDYKYMGRLFKNIVGITPTEYRRETV